MILTRDRERLETKQLVTITVIGVNLSLCDLISVIITYKHTLNMNTQIRSYDTSQGREEAHPWPREEISFLGRRDRQMGVCLSCLQEIIWSKWHMMITDVLWELMYLNVCCYDINIMLLVLTSMTGKPIICIADLWSSNSHVCYNWIVFHQQNVSKYTMVLPWCSLKHVEEPFKYQGIIIVII